MKGPQEKVDQEYIVIDYETKEIKGEIIGSPDQYLKVTRETIKLSWPDLKDFEFCYQNGHTFGMGSENKGRLKKISTQNYQINFKRKGSFKEDKQAKNLKQRDQKIEQIIKDKDRINSALKQLDQFQKERNIKTEQAQQKCKKKIQNLNKCLQDLNIEMKLQNTNDLYNQAKNLFKSKQTQNEKAIQFLKTKVVNQVDLLKNSGKVCRGYFMRDQVLQKIIDYNNLQFNLDNENCDFQTYQHECMTKNQTEQFQKNINLSNNKKQGDFGIATIGFAIKAGCDQSKLQQKSFLDKNVTQTEFTKKYHFSKFIGVTISVTSQKLSIISNVKKDYEKLIREYFKKKLQNSLDKDDYLQKECLKFFQKYGYQVEIGDYLFGSVYLLENQLRFNKNVSLAYAKEITDRAFNFSSTIGGFTQYFIAAGKATLINNDKQAEQNKKERLQVEYNVTKKVNAWPYVQSSQLWKEIAPKVNACWKLIQKRNTQKVLLTNLLKNNKNRTIYLKQLGERVYEFQKYINQVYQTSQHNKIMKKQKKAQNLIHLVLVGRTGSGKSTFGNQLIGNDLSSPFQVSSSPLSKTKFVSSSSYGLLYNIYDTPGFSDNRDFACGHVVTTLSQSINKHSKNNIYEYINCFIFVLHATNRVSFLKDLEEFMQAFGSEALRNTLFILNMLEPPKKFNAKQFLEDIKQFKQIKQKLCPTFNYQKQVYWNYKFDLAKKTQQQWFNQYLGHRSKIFYMAQQFDLYTSDDFDRIRKQAQKEQQQKNKRQMQQNQQKKIQKDKKQKEQIQKIKKSQKQFFLDKIIQYYFNNLGYFTLQSQKSSYYIGFGKIGIILFGQDGFNLFSNSQRLALQFLSININKGYISGYLKSEKRDDARMSTNQGNRLGYRQPSQGHTIQTVQILFQSGRDGLISMSNSSSYNKVKIRICGDYLVDKDNQLYAGLNGTTFLIRKAGLK